MELIAPLAMTVSKSPSLGRRRFARGAHRSVSSAGGLGWATAALCRRSLMASRCWEGFALWSFTWGGPSSPAPARGCAMGVLSSAVSRPGWSRSCRPALRGRGEQSSSCRVGRLHGTAWASLSHQRMFLQFFALLFRALRCAHRLFCRAC